MDGDSLQRFRGQILFQELLLSILQDTSLVKENDSESGLEYAKRYIEQHYQQELTIDHLAKVAGISTRHFMRLFKKGTDIARLTIWQYSELKRRNS